MDDEIIGKVFGCVKVDKLERHRFPSGHTVTKCYGHCIHCGAPVARTLSEIKHNPPKHCKNCPKWSRAEPPKVHPGQEFPGLIILAMVGEPKGIATMWRCRCKVCGSECIVDQSHLKVYKSCGCLSKKEREAGLDFYRSLCKDGTCYSSLLESRKINKNSSTGVRGVCRGHRKAYRAYISIRRKHISLGEYDTLEEAAAARKAGEEKYFSPERAAFEADGVTVKGPYKPKKGENKKNG